LKNLWIANRFAIEERVELKGAFLQHVGAAVVTERQTLMITGDLSFFYDANALWNSHLPKELSIDRY
jgi:hypothetical protein